ncbi:MAG: alpha/beta fold hydrolase [Bacteroidota bacterium]
MKFNLPKIIVCLLLFVFITPALAQQKPVAGKWEGMLDVTTTKLKIVFRVFQEPDQSYTALMDSPDQGAENIGVKAVFSRNDSLILWVTDSKTAYLGKFDTKHDTLYGQWIQGGQKFPCKLFYAGSCEKPKRPQTPSPLYPYTIHEVTVKNEKAGNTLSGTLTIPQGSGPFPAVVLVSGSGAQDRDEELMGHKPFWIIADYLTRKGIAVLRYDDRGVGKSTGSFMTATTYDFTDDALAALHYICSQPEIDSTRCGIIGHSEGGIVAPIAATMSPKVKFIVMLAGTGITGKEIILHQSEIIARASGEKEKDIKAALKSNKVLFGYIDKYKDTKVLSEKIASYLRKKKTPEQAIMQTTFQMISPWFRTFLVLDPKVYLSQVKCPVLALNGSLDLQVDPKQNLEPIRKALAEAGNKNVTITEYPGLNHLFQHCTTGSPSEYGKIEETFSPEVLKAISEWIVSLKGK